MGTWICHLRVAESLFEQIPGLDEQAFIVGNLSPDSGLPNQDWTEFDPPKEITHFMQKDETEANIRDFWFFRQYLLGFPKDNVPAYSFRLGYLFHLICDNLWMKLIGRSTLAEHAKKIEAGGLQPVIELVKRDWYGLDHIYVRTHPHSSFWRVFMTADNPPSYLDFIPLPALHQQLDYIRGYYSNPDPERILDRPFPYLNERNMVMFVRDCVDISIAIYRSLDLDPVSKINESFLELIEPQRYAAYLPPLGDPVEIHP